MTFSCGETHYDSRLTAIDSIIEDRPDSALVELWALDYESLSGSDNRAYYALLLTQAQYKSYDSIPSTDTIEIAVAQFTSNGDREKHTRSLIYKDAILAGSFYQCDPLAEKYYSLSPYSWCAGNPMKYTDERGDTISVLHLRGSIGHLALLIQNIDGKWAYYSYNGTPIYEKTTGSFGGKQYHDLGSKTFNSPEEFMNSTYNREGSKEEVRNDEINNYGYNEAYTIPTDSEQDNKIRSAFQSEAKKPYNLLDHQCAQVVQLALNAGGISTKKIFDIEFNILGLTIKRKIDLYPFYPFTPADTFETIRQNNP